MDNVIVCPHHSPPSQPEEMIKYFIENLRRFECEEPLEGMVNLKKGY
jgi:phosphoglycerate dehydrogenase-like enzyme